MHRKSKPKFKLPTYLQICAVIFVITAFTSIVMTSRVLDGEYYYGGAKAGVTVFLMGFLSLSLFYGLVSNNKKLLFWTCSVEFILLLLPFITFSMAPDYLPYVLLPILIVTFPLLWILLPIAFFYLIENEKKELKCMSYLRALTLLLWVSWLLSGVFNYMKMEIILLFLLPLAIPLIFWEIGYNASRRSIKFDIRHRLGIIDKIGKNFSVFLMFSLIIIILFFGYLWAMPQEVYGYSVCGDGVCDYGYDEEYFCSEDCDFSYCGDGYCDSYYDEDYYCPEDCAPSILSRDVKVYIDGGTSCNIFSVTLLDQSGNLISSKEITTRSVTFEDVEATGVSARVSSTGSTKDYIISDYINTESRGNIRVYIPDDFCTMGTSGDLEICVRENGVSATSGVVVAEDAWDHLLLLGEISDSDPAEVSNTGCYLFKNIPVGEVKTVYLENIPPGCTVPTPQDITITPKTRHIVYLDLYCS